MVSSLSDRKMKNHQFGLRVMLLLVLVTSLGFAWLHERWRMAWIIQHREITAQHERDTISRLSSRVSLLSEKRVALGVDPQNRWHTDEAVLAQRIMAIEHLTRGSFSTFDPGYLEVVDPKKAFVKQFPASSPTTWNYRVYLPRNRLFQLKTATRKEQWAETSPLLFGRVTVEISVLRNVVHVKFPQRDLTAMLDRDFDAVAKRLAKDVNYTQSEFAVDKPIQLLRVADPDDVEGPPVLEVFLEMLGP